jgi:membrane glycosyltransferase
MIEKVMGVYNGLFENKKAFICGWGAFIATAVLTAIICSMLPLNIKSLMNGLDHSFPSYNSPLSSFGGILLNNIKTCLQIFVFALIPILFFPWISIIFNSALLGFIAYVVIALHC